MKHLFAILIFFFASATYAQSSSINYKALIKDNLGNVVANQTITVQFSILKGTFQTNVYQETQTPTTDANGLIIVNIGEGTTSDDFSTINWSSDDHFLNVQINTGAGLTDMGTTQFMAVPYALSAANVTGLEAIDQGYGIGYRIKGRNPANYNSIGEDAVDLSISKNTSTTNGASGVASLAMGYRTIASGFYSTAMGDKTDALGFSSTAMGSSTQASGNFSTAIGKVTLASGDFSTAMGYYTDALGERSTAMGSDTEASGNISTAMGYKTTAEAYASTAIGRFNTGGGTTDSWLSTDPLFEVGNGYSSSNKSNALTILKNGTITAPSFNLTEITDDKALITKEYADTNLTSSGLEAIDEGDGIGWRLKGKDPANYGTIGKSATDLSESTSASTSMGATGRYSFATGRTTEASGDYSVAMGYQNTTASGDYSFALGITANASGSQSVAMGTLSLANESKAVSIGTSTTSSGTASLAMGYYTKAFGNYATAMGYNTYADAYASTAFGKENIGGGNATTWIATDPLFEIGNGDSNLSRSNAVTVLKNGYVGFNGNPDTDFHLLHGNNGLASGMKLENNSNNAWWRFYVSSGSDDLRLYSASQGATIIGAFDDISGNYTSTSDRRLKKNFEKLHFNWTDFMKLETLTYQYKAQKDTKEYIGLIAQDVQPIYPELINYNEDSDVYHLNYSGFGVIAIKAVQEQQKIILSQQLRIEALEAQLSKKDEAYNALSSRIETIETFLKTSEK
ncbi:tail fiber domain-containing protein [Xanthomarina sp. GH4-25]|uniref:tail fiber domain-containing protein n=1 Tax=Xanthomarina sp. GH4-25 TaxID=3349335 RepID=UPI000D6763FB|nr:hypothetical protein DI383_12015 [Flavobacteriaceae bacterium LYZ1037]